MFGLGTQELLIILLIAFFVFGGKKLPEIGAGLGKGLKAFKSGLKDLENEVDPEKLLDDKSSSSSDTEGKKKV
ncbi:MAG: twin-arginine translocase TatA/TatE family subunit [Deltaproteobacteria bacterium]|nr:twin-arginine translocase TatA/TatE family subunit [Deltaproteobacteria bacterium]MBW1947286.1 twin-arginine translocase TatA/TatE family subunit [Deltaproteobacteria bacterium]MBW1967018.1 twin-arginine translocase TatA/TatE family subunit [Deltaproteobacteria bacterium]MBW2098451.1 twin-arginine translocase TatA/TatE family subunit [Deltaproteobacteria bacterium]PXF54443.1 MAG: twin-arginine translocase TatA/TatE family subunit [Deltaproteobacteria bacterium]